MPFTANADVEAIVRAKPEFVAVRKASGQARARSQAGDEVSQEAGHGSSEMRCIGMVPIQEMSPLVTDGPISFQGGASSARPGVASGAILFRHPRHSAQETPR
jgi:hypothetical protein